MKHLVAAGFLAMALVPTALLAQDVTAEVSLPAPTEPLNISMDGYAYPHDVKLFEIDAEQQKLNMAYMDVAPTRSPNGKTIVLMHGGLGIGATWGETIDYFANQGFRVVVPDQIGFGKSSRDLVKYSMFFWAKNTHDLLQSLSVEKPIIVGHSMGGAMAARMAIMYPDFASQLVLANPLGLEDYRLTIPFKTVDEMAQGYLKQDWAAIEGLHRGTYTEWNDISSQSAIADYRVSIGPDNVAQAYAKAYINQTAYLDPYVYELERITVPTLLTWGELDKTVPGKGYAAPEVRPTLGNFAVLTEEAAKRIPDVEVYMFADVNHVPHIEVPDEFRSVVMDFIQE